MSILSFVVQVAVWPWRWLRQIAPAKTPYLGTYIRDLVGESGALVSSCRCIGEGMMHGHCGFHFHFGSEEAQPWCRTKYGCGLASPMGSWQHCNVRGVERRRGVDGYLYNAKEFRNHYWGKGKTHFEASKPLVERGVAEDGHLYTAEEFRAFYVDAYGEEGWAELWQGAGPEVRRAADGHLWTFEDFRRTHGTQQALVSWEAAEVPTIITVSGSWLRRLWAITPRPGRIDAKPEIHGERGQPVSSCTCKGTTTTHGTCGFHLNSASSENEPWCRTKHGCGFHSVKGSWYYCDVQGVERRRADDGYFYHAKDFRDQYSGFQRDRGEGKRKYEASKSRVERRQERNGVSYTAAEFRSFYIDALGEEGWLKLWATAGPERRSAPDGGLYTFEQFSRHHGANEGWRLWDAAGASCTRVDRADI